MRPTDVPKNGLRPALPGFVKGGIRCKTDTAFILLEYNPLFQRGYFIKAENNPTATLSHSGSNLPLDPLSGVPALPAKQNRSQGPFYAQQLLFVVKLQCGLDWQNRKFQVAVPF